jgi:phage terminase small subunit
VRYHDVLTAKQRRFVTEYLVDLNATQAAIRAGYSAHVAYHQGYENLKKPHIQAAIAARQQALQQQCAVTQERVIQELAAIAFSSLTDYCRWGPDGVHLHPSTTVTPAHSQVMKQLVVTTTEQGCTIRITLHDKIAALDKLARHLGLYTGQGPEDPWAGRGLSSLVEQAREDLKTELDKLAAKVRENGQGEG